MKFESIVKSDLDQIRLLQPKGWKDITKDIQFYIESDCCFPFKLVNKNQLLGIGTSIVFGNTAWLAHIIVNENYRNQGMGYSITNYLVDNLKKKSIDTILLIATAMGEPVYKKVGFKVISDYVELKSEKVLKEFEISKNIIPYQQEYYSRILQLDKEISGENRECFIKGHIERSKLYTENGELKGYYIPDLGDGIIFAIDSKAGIELLKLKHTEANKAVLPKENKAGIQFLLESGFSEPVIKGKRMVLGKEIDWKPECFFSRSGGNVG